MTAENLVHLDCDIVGRDTGLAPVLDRVRRVLGVPVNVLIIGESGTGKELVARLHLATAGQRLNPMINSIFDQGLQYQAGNFQVFRN